MRREEKAVDQKSLSLSALKLYYLNLNHSVRATKRENIYHSKCRHCEESHPTENYFKQQRKIKGTNKFSSYFNSHNPNNKRTESNNINPNTCFRCGSEDHWITDLLKPESSENRFYVKRTSQKNCIQIDKNR